MRNTDTISPLRRPGRLLALLAAICALLAIGAHAARAAGTFGVEKFDGEVTRDAAGDPATQAGSHPFQATTEIDFTHDSANPLIPAGNFKNVNTLLPAGLVGNPNATPKCTMAEFQASGASILEIGECADATAVGYAEVGTGALGTIFAPVYNLVPEADQPARFGFHVLSATIYLNLSVRTGGDYGLDFDIRNSSQGLPVSATKLTFWGVPYESSHDEYRGKCLSPFAGAIGSKCPVVGKKLPFLTNPTSCEGPVRTTLEANSWQEPDAWAVESFLSHDNHGILTGAEGCDKLPFEPSFEVKATPGAASSPSSVAVDIKIPQSEGPEQLASAQLKDAVVTLPQGVTVDAAAANGLAACSAAEIEIEGPRPPTCPDASKIGTTEILSPLLGSPLQGSVYLARQGENKFGSLLAVYLVAEAEGVVIKLPGEIETNSATGQVTASFDNNPQLPFSDLGVRFFGGAGAVLTTGPTCGDYTATGEFTPWSGTATVTRQSSFAVTSGPAGGPCPNGGFAPKLRAGAVNPAGGRYSGFTLDVTREDGGQTVTGIDATLPKGVLAKLAGVPYCPEASIASIPTAVGTGAAQVGSPSCPAASQVGTVAVAAGTGPTPVPVNTGKAYLAGPYKGAPLSLVLVTPALAGPFDLGNVVVRAALKVDPETAQVEAVSDPIPTIIAGIPLNLRQIRVDIDRGEFMVNPTSCAPSAVSALISGGGGAMAALSSRFQAASCARLGFSPKVSLRLQGSRKRAGYPKLTATVTAKPGQANLSRVAVTMPRSEFLAQSHIRTICTRVQFAASKCPAGSIYGYAKAFSPLLDRPLAGPVYLRSSSHKLPDLVASLNGQIHIDLDGRIDAVNGGIRTTFEGIPDAAISKFVLRMKGGKKGLLQNSRDLCVAGVGRATAKVNGQNGKTADQHPALAAGCGKAR